MPGVNTIQGYTSMKKLLALILIIPLLTSAESEVADAFIMEKKLVCDQTSVMMEVLTKGNAQETPIWGGSNDNARFGLLVNQETGTWTMIQFNKDIACILGHGENSFAIPRGKRV